MVKRSLYFILLLLAASACFNLNKISLYNLSAIYSRTSFTELKAVAFNVDENSTRILVPVIRNDMIQELDEEKGRVYIKFSVKYELFRTYESKDILDSASFVISDSTLSYDDTLVKIDINYPSKGKYILKLELTDLNRVDVVRDFYVLDNTGEGSGNNFLLRGGDDEVLFRTSIFSTEELQLEQSVKGVRRLMVRYYQREFPLALPPFLEESNSRFDFKADSVFSIALLDGKTDYFYLPEEGFYHFQVDSSQRSGYTIYRFYDGFPKVNSTQHMLTPLRYITTKKEYEDLLLHEDTKLAVDNFWLENAGNPTRAKAMIQKFYSRVEEANSFFTSYHEGWKTDRGLLYIVYGPPKIVYRGNNVEEWIYGEKGNSNSIRFEFVKVENPFSENDYSLVKSPSYKEKWYNIVNTWRR